MYEQVRINTILASFESYLLSRYLKVIDFDLIFVLKVKMKLTICVFLAFAGIALTYAYPAEQLVMDVVQDDVAPVYESASLGDSIGDAVIREKRHHHHHHGKQ